MHEESVPSRQHGTFGEILEAFLADARAAGVRGSAAIEAGCFAVAGPVVEGCVHTTNLPWTLDEIELAKRIHAPRVELLNDLEGTAFGMLHLPAADLVTLNAPAEAGRKGNVAVIAAGTGLGEAYLYWDGSRHHPIASEGGHSDFAPRTDQEVDLLRHLRQKLGGRVSYERVLSGPGVYEIYSFLRERGRGEEPDWLSEELADGDPSAVISIAASSRGEPTCVATMDLFCELYGAEAGNMALRALTFGGVYLGGGIAPKNLAFLQNGSFLRGFLDKGRFAEMLHGIEVRVSMNPRTALLGAAHYASDLTG